MKYKKGFTLLEILIVVILFGIIAGIVNNGLRFVVNNVSNSNMTVALFDILKKGVGEYVSERGIIKTSQDLCVSLSEMFNVTTDVNCSASIISTDKFKDSTSNFSLKNGAVFYNFGADLSSNEARVLLDTLKVKEQERDALDTGEMDYIQNLNVLNSEIAQLKTDLAQVDAYYTVYIDIDGKNSRRSTLDDDVITFIINVYGEVLPSGIIANNVSYLSAGYKQLKKEGLTSNWVWVKNNIPFKEAICKSGIKLQTQSYCAAGTFDSVNCSNTICTLHVNKPVNKR